MNDEPEKLPNLETNRNDRLAAVVRGFSGLVPVAGGFLAELITEIVPNQRMDRLAAFAQALGEKLAALEASQAKAALSDPEKVDLFEEGAAQSVRALTEERKEYIARVVAEGISGEQADALQAKQVLNILSELTDDEIVRLAWQLERYQHDTAFNEKHEAVLAPVAAHMGSSREDLDASAVRVASNSKLRRLGLLAPRFKEPRRGEMPEFDKNTGMLKATSHYITPLGRLVLRRIGLASDEDF